MFTSSHIKHVIPIVLPPRTRGVMMKKWNVSGGWVKLIWWIGVNIDQQQLNMCKPRWIRCKTSDLDMNWTWKIADFLWIFTKWGGNLVQNSWFSLKNGLFSLNFQLFFSNFNFIFRILSREGWDLWDEILSQKTWKNERKSDKMWFFELFGGFHVNLI